MDRAQVYDELISLQSEPGRQDELIATLEKVLRESRAKSVRLASGKEAQYRELLAQLLYDKERPMEALQIIRATPIRVRTASLRLLERSIVEDLRGRADTGGMSEAERARVGLPPADEEPGPLSSRVWAASVALAQSESIGSGAGGLRYAHPVSRGVRLFGDVDGFRYETNRFLVENRLRTTLGVEWAGPSSLIFTGEGGYLWSSPAITPLQARAEVKGPWLLADHASLSASLADDNASSPESLLAGVSESTLRLYWERQLAPTMHLTFQNDLKLAHYSGMFGAGRGLELSARLGFSPAIDRARPPLYSWAVGPWGQATAWRTDNLTLNQLLTDDTNAIGVFGRFGKSTGGSLLSPSFNVALGFGRDFLKETAGVNAGFVEGNLAGNFTSSIGYSVELAAYFEEISAFRTGGGTRIGRFDLIWTLP